MPVRLDAIPLPGSLPFDTVIDVRAPGEYAEDHIPGAINLPVLSDEERAWVGTIYVREDRFLARKVGAALVARNSAVHIEGPLAQRDGGWRPLVYCWRGGQRSGSFASILEQIGWRVDLVEGGYRSYRRLIVGALYDTPLPHRLVMIDGGTGTGKTRLLHHLAEAGAQIVDLEGLAGHRGSNFGALPGGQPSQKMFESHLARAFTQADPARPVFVEAESNAIGNRRVPPSVWAAMGRAETIRLEAPRDARARFLTRAYPDLVEDPERLSARIESLRPYHPKDRIAAWHGLATGGDYTGLAADLIEHHYDPRYRRATERPTVGTISMEDLDETELARAAARLLEMVPG